MSTRTVAAIQADLTACYAARLAVLKNQSYQLDTGQSRQTVTRANLTEINRLIDSLKAELEEAEQLARGDSGIVSLAFRRDR